MELNISLDSLWLRLDRLRNLWSGPFIPLYKYNERVNKLFAQIDYDQAVIIEDNGYYVQIFDQKSHIYIRTWITNSPYAILCEGSVSLARIDITKKALIFEWERKYRPSRYEMGRFLRFYRQAALVLDDEDEGEGVTINGPFVQNNGKFYETIELPQDEWERKYAIFLLKE